MSPEQFRGSDVDARSDVFSFCVALWEAIYGERPFVGETVAELRSSVTLGARRPAPEDARVPLRLRRALERGLAVDRAGRWPTMGPLLEVLSDDPDDDPSAAARERRLLVAIIGSFMLLVAGPLTAANLFYDIFDVRVGHVLFPLAGLCLLTGVSIAFRRTLLRNAYHRRIVIFLGAMAAMVSLQGVVGLALGSPFSAVLASSGLAIFGMLASGALFFARWMLGPALLVALAALVGILAPGIFPAGLVVTAPLFFLTFGLLWRRAAHRGIA